MSIRVPNCNQFVSLGFSCTGVICPASSQKLLGFEEQNEPTFQCVEPLQALGILRLYAPY